MVSAKKLAQMAKWQRLAAMGRKRLTRTTTVKSSNEFSMTSSLVAVKGHCVMYSIDGIQFEVPLAYLGTTIISELLRMVKDEFGFVSDGTITLPFDAAIMEYAMCLLRREAAEEVMKAFFSSVARLCSFDSGVVMPCIGLNQHLAVC